MRKVLVALVAAGIAILTTSGMAFSKHTARRAGYRRVELAEPGGVILLFRVVAPAGTRAKVAGVIPEMASVSMSVPRVRGDSAETCSRHGRTISCTEGEEACPMPPATWHFLVHRLAGPAGPIRIDFMVGPAPRRGR